MKLAGMSTEAAVSQAEANALIVEAAIIELRRQVTETENNLSALLGNTSQSIRVSTESVTSQPLPVLVTGVPAELLSKRPDVRHAENVLREMFYATNAARSAFYPSVSLSASGGWLNNAGTSILNPAQAIVSAVGSLVQPLFAQGRLRAQLKIAKTEQEEAALRFAQSLLDAGTEINNALSSCLAARHKQVFYKRQISHLENAVRSTHLLMKNSSNTTYIEVLTAQQALLDSHLTDIANEFEEIQNRIMLYRALGGGIR